MEQERSSPPSQAPAVNLSLDLAPAARGEETDEVAVAPTRCVGGKQVRLFPCLLICNKKLLKSQALGGHQMTRTRTRTQEGARRQLWDPYVYDHEHHHAAAAAQPPDCRRSTTDASMSVPIFSHGGPAAETADGVKLEMPADDGGAPPYYMDHVVLPAAAPYHPCAKRDDDTVDNMRVWKRTSHKRDDDTVDNMSADTNTAASSSAGEEMDLELRL